jgi:hypothetical protein
MQGNGMAAPIAWLRAPEIPVANDASAMAKALSGRSSTDVQSSQGQERERQTRLLLAPMRRVDPAEFVAR